jgi:glycosyltransferase involved in cell wall biosynthesis
MRIALDVSAVPARIAGAGRYIAELARRLPPLGVETTLVTRHHDATRWRELSPHATVAPILPDDRVRRLAFEAWRLGRSEAARGVEVWHAPHYTMPRRGSTPTVVTIHDLTFFTNPEWHERSKVAFFRRAIKYSATHADVLISVSEFTARQIEALIPHHAPLVVASLGVDLQQFSTDSSRDRDLFRAHGLAADVPYVFFLGTVEPRKGLDVLLEAFARVAKDDETTELWLAGQVGWGIKEFDETLARHPAASRIRRLGFVDDAVLPALLRQSRAVAYPSRGEGFGLPVLEALACGASVVTTGETVMAEVAGDAALLVPIGDAPALVDALSSALAASAAERAVRSSSSRSRAELFTWDASLDQHLKAYEMARSKP